MYLTRKYLEYLENKSPGPSSIPLNMLSVIPDLIILPLPHYQCHFYLGHIQIY